jgi:hypothetical protein
VNAHLIIADTEGAVLKNIKDKDAAAAEMASQIVDHMRDQMRANIKGTTRTMDDYIDAKEMDLPPWLCTMVE